MFNVDQITSRLAKMTDAQLAQFAQMHRNDPYMLPLANTEDNRRREVRQATQGAQAGAMGQPPTVADQTVGKLAQDAQPQVPPQAAAPQALPENTGIAPLKAPNIQHMAEGGIAGYASGTHAFDVDAYMNNPNVQKYLAYVNAYEGKPKENHLVGYKTFDDLSDHPGKRVRFGKAKNQVSTAAGSYQILKKSWDEQKKKLGLNDFSLENQQRAAIGLLKDNGALKYVAKGDFQKANEKAKNIWASLPGSTIGEATGQRPRVRPELEAALGKKEGIEKLATAEARPSTTAPRQRVAAPKEEKFGLNPDLAKFFNKYMPGTEAHAGELNRADTVAALKPGEVAAAQPQEKGMWDALKERFENASKSGVAALPSLINPNLGKLLHNKERTIPAESEGMAQIRAIEENRATTPRPARKVVEPSLAEKLAASPEAAAGAVSGMVAPWTGAGNLGISRLLGNKNKTYEQAAAEMSYDPRTEAGKAALADVYGGLDSAKVPPFFDIPNALPLRAEKPLMSKAEQAGRVNRAAEAEAALARQREMEARAKEGPKQGELDLGPGGSEAGLSADAALRAQQKMYQEAVAAAEAKRAQADAARAQGAQGELFETGTNTPPVEMVNPKYERARIANDIRNEQAAEVAKTAKAGQEARLKQAATENIRAGESVKAGERQLEKQDTSRKIYEDILRDNAGNRTLGQGIGLTSTGGLGLKGQLPETKTRPPAFEEGFTAPETNYQKPDLNKTEKKEVKDLAKASPEGQAAKKEGLKLDDKDWLNLGLNLLSAGPSRGNMLQGFLTDIGTAGKATLGAKEEREKVAADQAFKAIQGQYYKGMTENLGKPQGEERYVERYARDPNFAAASDTIQSGKNAAASHAALVKTYLEASQFNPEFAKQYPWEEFLKTFGPKQQGATLAPETSIALSQYGYGQGQ